MTNRNKRRIINLLAYSKGILFIEFQYETEMITPTNTKEGEPLIDITRIFFQFQIYPLLQKCTEIEIIAKKR